MEYRRLGKSGLKVSKICLGAMMFGGRTEENEAAAIIDSARDAGVNFIDTADNYNGGKSEEVVGRQIAKDRDRWILATKVYNPAGKEPNYRGLSRSWIMREIENSRKRLNTDFIDIYYMHKDDEETPIEETVHALADLIHQNKIRYIGLSNYRGWRISEFVRACDAAGIDRPVVCQPYYNAMNRQPEVEVLPACDYYGIGVVPYSPLARGILTGKYLPGQEPDEGSRAGAKDKRLWETEFREESLVMAQEIKKHAEAKGMTPGQFAMLWVLNNRIITASIAGPRTMEQWEAYLDTLNHEFTAEDEALVDSMVAPGHPSTPGYNDPQYPFAGRLPWTD